MHFARLLLVPLCGLLPFWLATGLYAQTDTIEDSGDGIEALGVLGDGLIRRAFVIDENNRTQAIFFSLDADSAVHLNMQSALESVTLQLFEGESRAPLVEVVGNAADMVLALAQGKDYRLAVVSAPQSRPLISLAIDIQSLEVPLVEVDPLTLPAIALGSIGAEGVEQSARLASGETELRLRFTLEEAAPLTYSLRLNRPLDIALSETVLGAEPLIETRSDRLLDLIPLQVGLEVGKTYDWVITRSEEEADSTASLSLTLRPDFPFFTASEAPVLQGRFDELLALDTSAILDPRGDVGVAPVQEGELAANLATDCRRNQLHAKVNRITSTDPLLVARAIRDSERTLCYSLPMGDPPPLQVSPQGPFFPGWYYATLPENVDEYYLLTLWLPEGQLYHVFVRNTSQRWLMSVDGGANWEPVGNGADRRVVTPEGFGVLVYNPISEVPLGAGNFSSGRHFLFSFYLE